MTSRTAEGTNGTTPRTRQSGEVESAAAFYNSEMLDSIDAWLLSQRSLMNSRRKDLVPAVKSRK